jgi:predicted DNA-binding transcriptional regulator YafY
MARLMAIVFEVESRPGVTAAELAEELGVSARTVYRDVSALQQAGVPLYGEPGRGGGLRLVDGYRSRSAALGSEEAAALLAGVVPAVAEALGVDDQARRARRKVRSQTGTAGPPWSEAQVVVDPVGWYRAARDTPFLPLVAEALRSRRRLEVVYRRWSDPPEVRRLLEPQGLVLKAGTWYLMARSGPAVRSYRVDQITDAALTDERFEPDPEFDLAAAWAAFVSSFHERMRVLEVTVSTNRAARDRMRSEGDAALAEAVSGLLQGTEDDEAERIVALPFESVERAAADLLRFGDDIEILAPPVVREATTALLQRVTDRYSVAGPRSRGHSNPSELQ